MATVAIDIDETLYSFDSAVRNAFFDMAEERDDKSILRMAYSNNFEWRNLVDHDKGIAYEAIERVHSEAHLQNPFPNAVDTCWKIKKSGHHIIYIGSRFEKHRYNTENFLEWWDFPGGNLICADPRESKLDHLKECQYLIDDRPKTVLEFLNDPVWPGKFADPHPDRKAFALWRPYNQNLTEVKNLYLAPTWRGLRYYLKRKGVINGES
jgi:hypothetical protein